MNKRSAKLDKFINELVEITFTDGDVRTGVLEFDMPLQVGSFKDCPSHMYSVFVFGKGYIFFKKSHVKRIREWRKDEIKIDN